MEIYLYYFCAYLIEGIAFWQYCTNLFTPKQTVLVKFCSLLLSYGILAIIFSFEITWLNLLLFTSVNFLFIFTMYDAGISSALFHSTIITAIMSLSELIVLSFFPHITYNFYNSPNYKSNYILMLFFTKIPYLALLYVIAHFLCKKKEKNQPNTKELLLLLIVPIASIWIIFTFSNICLNYELTSSQNNQLTVSCVLLFIINIITWAVYTFTHRKNQEFTNIQLQLQKEYDTTEYYKMLLQQNENQQILIHDIKKHLQSIALLNEQGQQNKITTYIHQIIHSSDLQQVIRICDNELLNAILCRYAFQCQQVGIAFHTDIRSEVTNFINDDNLTSLFCNLLDNALEASKNYPDGYIELNVWHHPNTHLTTITMVNSCRTNPFDKNGRLISHKTNTLRHGFGLKSIERIVKIYQGEMQLYYSEEDYTFHTIIALRNVEKKKD